MEAATTMLDGHQAPRAVDARTIDVRVRFWMNEASDGDGRVAPKHAWSSGVVCIERNSAHGIDPERPEPFHSLLDLSAVIEKVLVQHGIVVHPSRRMRHYLAPGTP